MARFTEKVALIVGGATGIGRATALLLAERGARVVIGDVNLEGAHETADAILSTGAEAVAVKVDIADEAQVAALVQAAVDAFGGLNILHNNAALTSSDIVMRDRQVDQMDTPLWDHVLSVNLRGAMLACKYALPHLIANPQSTIVNTTSALALQGDSFPTAYSVSKAGLIGLTRSLAVQYGKQGLRANAIAVGLVMSEALDATFPDTVKAMMLEHHLTPYLGIPRHIADVVAFLASSEAAYITGQIIAADGGITAHVPQLADFRRMQL